MLVVIKSRREAELAISSDAPSTSSSNALGARTAPRPEPAP